MLYSLEEKTLELHHVLLILLNLNSHWLFLAYNFCFSVKVLLPLDKDYIRGASTRKSMIQSIRT
uniref:Uncharacterized protein n=1 Tax=Triticum urartu TaxID=4572 RepID=A0A8R7RBD9_TRIUA